MRATLLVLLLPCLGGCSALIRGSGYGPYGRTRAECHELFGEPVESRIEKGVLRETFHTRRKISRATFGIGMVAFGTLGLSEFYFVPREALRTTKEGLLGTEVSVTYGDDGRVLFAGADGSWLMP